MKTDIWNEDILSTENSAAAAELKLKQKQSEHTYGNTLTIDLSKLYVCINCKTHISDDDADDDDDSIYSEFVKYSSCKLTVLKESMSSAVTANVIIDVGGQNIGRFYCSGTVRNSMFLSIVKTEGYTIKETEVRKLSWKLIVEMLLLIKTVSFKVSKEDKVVESMEVGNRLKS